MRPHRPHQGRLPQRAPGQPIGPPPASRRRATAACAIGAAVLTGVFVHGALASRPSTANPEAGGADLSGRSLRTSDLGPGRYRLTFDLRSFDPAPHGPHEFRAALLVEVGQDGQVRRVEGLQTDLNGRPIQATRFDATEGDQRILDYVSCRLDRTEPPTALDAASFFSSVIGPLTRRAAGATSNDGEVAQTVSDGRDGALSSRVITERNASTGEVLTRIAGISLVRQSRTEVWPALPRPSGCRGDLEL